MDDWVEFSTYRTREEWEAGSGGGSQRRVQSEVGREREVAIGVRFDSVTDEYVW
jgi:hypothetical protein